MVPDTVTRTFSKARLELSRELVSEDPLATLMALLVPPATPPTASVEEFCTDSTAQSSTSKLSTATDVSSAVTALPHLPLLCTVREVLAPRPLLVNTVPAPPAWPPTPPNALTAPANEDEE